MPISNRFYKGITVFAGNPAIVSFTLSHLIIFAEIYLNIIVSVDNPRFCNYIYNEIIIL